MKAKIVGALEKSMQAGLTNAKVDHQGAEIFSPMKEKFITEDGVYSSMAIMTEEQFAQYQPKFSY
jgi:hypothetical protein